MTSQLLLDFASEVTVVQYTSREFGAPNVYKQTVQGRTRIKKGGKKGRLLRGALHGITFAANSARGSL